MAREFTRSLEDVTADSDMKEVKSMVADLKSGNLEDMARDTVRLSWTARQKTAACLVCVRISKR